MTFYSPLQIVVLLLSGAFLAERFVPPKTPNSFNRISTTTSDHRLTADPPPTTNIGKARCQKVVSRFPALAQSPIAHQSLINFLHEWATIFQKGKSTGPVAMTHPVETFLVHPSKPPHVAEAYGIRFCFKRKRTMSNSRVSRSWSKNCQTNMLCKSQHAAVHPTDR